jgi:hypothetical protein
MRKINHFGVPTSIQQEGESYAEDMKLYLTDFNNSPNKIEFLRFEEGSPMPELLQKVAHIAYEVPSLKEAMVDKEILIEPFDVSEELTCAFIVEEGIPIELMEFKNN